MAADGAAGDTFGASVAVHGERVLIGAWGDGDQGAVSGSAYVFLRTPAGWVQEAKLLPADGGGEDFFGWDVALDGDRAAVAAFKQEYPLQSGSVYVFERGPAGWVETAQLVPAGGSSIDRFGESVALRGDVIAVGATGPDGGGSAAGRAHVFEHGPGGWSETALLAAAGGETGDLFGAAVGLALAPEPVAVVGAPGWSDGTGTAHVFERVGASWFHVDSLIAADWAPGDRFGTAVAIAPGLIVAGADGDDDQGPLSGSAYVFEDAGTSWVQTAKLLPSSGHALSYFGGAVAVSGNVALAGAFGNGDGGENAGSVFVFRRQGVSWIETAQVLPQDGSPGSQLGAAVALWGSRAVAGARWDDAQGVNAGAAYPFPVQPELTALGSGAGAWYQGHTLTLHGGAFAPGLPAEVQLGNEPPLAATVLDCHTAEVAVPGGASGPTAAGPLDVTFRQGLAESTLTDAWSVLPSLAAEVTGDGLGGALVLLFAEAAQGGLLYLYASPTLGPAPISLPGVHHGIELGFADAGLLTTTFLGSTPSWGVHLPAGAVPAGASLHVQGFVFESGPLGSFSSFTNAVELLLP